MPLKIASWNINSVRLRIDQVARVLDEERPDVICLQETKCMEGQFPLSAFNDRGYVHSAMTCQKGYHGVAILSRQPFASVDRFRFGGKEDARHIAVTLGDGAAAGITLHNFYVPAGGDIPDPDLNPKFAHKLAYLDEMRSWTASAGQREDDPRRRPQCRAAARMTSGATARCSAWSATPRRKPNGCSPIQADGGWVDAVRHRLPEPQRVYTWWSYRSPNWETSDRGRRLDHVWTSRDLAPTIGEIGIRKHARSWDRPSDHVPLVAEFSV